MGPDGGAGAGAAGALGNGAGTAGSGSPSSPTNSQGTLPQRNQNGAGTAGSGTGSPFSDPATRGGSNMQSNPGAPANRMDNNTNSNPFPGPATGNPNAGARNGINPDSALNRGAGIDARTPDQRAAAHDTRQEMRQDLRNERRDDRQANRENDPNRWRFVQHNGEWWYWMPDNYWMYYRNNNWTRFDPYAYEPYSRYRTGYRGTVNNNNPDEAYFYDENGRRYRRDYSPNRRVLRDPDAGVRMGGAIGGAVGGDQGARIGAEIGGAVDGTR